MSKKSFRLVAMVLALLVACTALFVACKKKEEPIVTTALKSISVDASGAKAEFYVGEDYSANGLVVTATYQKSDGSAPYTETLKSTDYTVDSSKYNKAAAGQYEIRVSYTYEGTTKSAVFSVKVIAVSYDGLEVTLPESVAEIQHLSAEATTVEIDTAQIIVKETDVEGNVIDKAISGYSVELYRGKEQVELTDGKASVGQGAYQIWVSKASEVIADYVRSAFVTIYVLDDVKTLAWDSQAEGTIATQEEGDDVITETLKFVVTYESGATKVLGASDVTMAKLDTKTPGEDKTVTATYSEVNAKSETKTTSEATVTYTITAKPVEPGGEPIEVFMDASELTAATIGETTELISGISIIATSSKTVVIDSDTKTIDGVEFTQRIKLGGAGKKTERSFELIISGPSTIYVYAQSASGSADRDLGLFKEDGTELAAQTATGAAPVKLTFEVEAAGTYYIWSKNSGINVYGIKVITTPAGGEEREPVKVSVNASTLTAGDITETIEIGEGIYIVATSASKVSIDSNSKSADGLTFTQRIKLSGQGSTEARSIKIEATGAGTVTLYVITSSGGDLTRTLSLYDENGTLVEGSTTDGIPNAVTKVEFTITEAGTYYIWGSNAINVYYVETEF